MRIVFATAEVSPIAKTGGLGDVCGSLPKALAALGHEIVVFMPLYRQAREWFERNDVTLERATAGMPISWGTGFVRAAAFWRTTLPGTGIPLILVENDYFFGRSLLYEPRPDGFDDFLERYTFFCRALVEGCSALGISPEILHTHDWHTALLPVYLDAELRTRPEFSATRSVYTIHNLNYQGVAEAGAFLTTGLPSRYWAPDGVEHFHDVNPMKGGILYADQVTTVSPNYAREIQTPALGAGLDGVLRGISGKFTGILNGIDAEEWDPATDPLVPSHFSATRLGGKNLTKRALLREAKLRYKPGTPLLAVISRLVDQKGFQLLVPVLSKLLRAGAQAVILGSGEPQYEAAFRRIEAEHPDSCRVWLGFDNPLAHRIYAGSDILLMPSMYEPCGLNQMYALRYGTVPVVRLTGGLADTVIPFDGTNLDVATGFGFTNPSPEDLYAATWLAMLNYKEPKTWKILQGNGMSVDFSWARSAHAYDAIYRRAAAI